MYQIENCKRPSPSPSRSSIRSDKACRQPRVIQVNRDAATMVESARALTDWEGCIAPAPPPNIPHHAPFRSRTFSDGFIRNTSQELLLGVDCDACRALRVAPQPQDCPSVNRLCVDRHISHHEFDLVCNCNSNQNRDSNYPNYCPESGGLRGHAFNLYDVERLNREPKHGAAVGTHHSLDRKHTKTKGASVSGYISRQLISYDPTNNIVQKIKRNLSNLRKIGGDVITKKHTVQLSEMPADSSATLKKTSRLSLAERPRSDAACIFTSNEFCPDGELGSDAPAYTTYMGNADRCFDRTKNYSFTVERKTPTKIVKIRSFDSNDRLISRSSTTLGQTKYSTVDGRGGRCKSVPRQLSYGDFVHERSGGVGAPSDAVESWPDSAATTAPRDEETSVASEPRTFSREFAEPELVMLEASPRAAHCRCTCDKKLSSIFYNSQGEKRSTPAPDVTTGGAGGGARACGACGKTGTRWSSTGTTSSHSSTTTGNSSRVTVTHRRWCCVAALVLVAGTACVAGPLALRAPPGAPLHERLRLADRLLHDTPLVDGHNDLPWNIRKFLHNRIKDFKFEDDLRTIPPWATSSWSHTDLPRLKQGRIAAQFWAAYVPCDSQHRDAVQLIFEQIDLIQRLTDKYHPQLTLCTSASDIVAAHANHRICSLVGVEGGHAIGGSLGVLRTLYQVGVRYLTLTSTCDTPWAECASTAERPDAPPHGGLTPFGKVVVKEMNRLGMLVDLSHVSARTMRDALAVSRAPVLFSHSSARALCNTTRNVPDAVLRRLAANKGLVMVNFYASFLTCRNTATVHDAIAHINHIRDVAGVDSVGLGAGFDGINYTPQGLEDVSSYPLLFAELMEAGWTMDELRKLAGLNLLRVLGAAERVARELAAAQVAPYEDTPPRPPDPHNCSSQDV